MYFDGQDGEAALLPRKKAKVVRVVLSAGPETAKPNRASLSAENGRIVVQFVDESLPYYAR